MSYESEVNYRYCGLLLEAVRSLAVVVESTPGAVVRCKLCHSQNTAPDDETDIEHHPGCILEEGAKPWHRGD